MIIPVIGVNEYVDTGKELSLDLWHLPYTPFPGDGGNVVIAGHRISYASILPPPFFYLNRVEKGDIVYLEYRRNRYIYTVNSKEIVEKKEIKYEKRLEGNETLTLYTCTPLLTLRNRLIIIANLVRIE
ncbi:MAG: Sortase family protein [candidate division WS6 bacterium GW2011_GWF2_39_15]|uniref:Sortase family protein n=1 Tax=candidate division WS6 bacterium GW2011_GWF2_39_15 TaxID=1619100 RepID=A0A0G0Q7A1_9BACT|nr:MAG: Sortase family protein [candidate division WS6 bacterium GW2011_GWF2_39_15]